MKIGRAIEATSSTTHFHGRPATTRWALLGLGPRPQSSKSVERRQEGRLCIKKKKKNIQLLWTPPGCSVDRGGERGDFINLY